MINPYDSPQEEPVPLTLGEVTSRHGRGGVESADFVRVGFMMQLIGGALLVVGILAMFAHWVLGGIALPGAAIFVSGRGLAAYRKWAWYAAVVVALPFTLATSLFGALLAASSPTSLLLMMFPLVSGWICWVLLSNSGRDRYRLLCQAASQRKVRLQQPKAHPEIDPALFFAAPPVEPAPNSDPLVDSQTAITDELDRMC